MESPPAHLVSQITIDGMLSVHAVRAVYTALAGVGGVHRADVALGRATVEHDADVPPATISAAIELAGYAVTSMTMSRRGLPLL
jgi:copper chaperone CopZ